MEITEQLSDLIVRDYASVQSEALETARHVVRLSVLDWIAVTLAGKDEPVVDIVRQRVAEDGGVEHAYAVGLANKVPAKSAALINGTAAHSLDYDDTHFAYLGHPTVCVVPAVLAIADREGADLQSILEAVLVGKETATRMGIWLGRTHYRKGFHITPTTGTFGAAAACCRILNLTREETRMALGLAASRASGIKGQFGTMGKPYHAGMAASAGVEVALMAQRGFTAGTLALDGEQGFSATHHGENNEAAFKGMGETWLLEDVSHKFHACCHGTHAMIEALNILVNQNALKTTDIRSIEVSTHPQYRDVCNKQNPITSLEAKFSYRLIAAMVLTGIDTARLESFSDAACKDLDLISVRDRVSVKLDDSLGETQSHVAIETTDGQSLSQTFDLLDKKPLHEREAKVRFKAASLLGKERAERVWSGLLAERPIADSRNLTISEQLLCAV